MTSLMSIEDVIALSEEARIQPLLTRKKALKMFGGKATAMNVIVQRQPEEISYITITRARWKEDDPWLDNAKRALEEVNEEGR